MSNPQQTLDADGYALAPDVLSAAECAAVIEHTARAQTLSGNSRSLLSQAWCAALARRLRQHPVLAKLMPQTHVAVQCTYFEKSPARNWLVSIHQDPSIPVAEQVEHPALRGASIKEGTVFVQPPAEVLAQLLALRLHLDPCSAQDGALRVWPGTHRMGRLTAQEAAAQRAHHAEVICETAPGAVLAMRPLLLHASSKADDSSTSRRRVLHFLFGPPALPYGLHWQIAV
ncbi:MAG: phytanoyl-CoA dioxygenase family protein [Zoogloeaceae bacterium]|jgi:ectoine hydroxylase-related dioxygenase (phytanoyl-CoA dioxygenase family)|nr:phytanoyl-CoA dioxygenase family protein [Zoogloeaceae bacterium]